VKYLVESISMLRDYVLGLLNKVVDSYKNYEVRMCVDDLNELDIIAKLAERELESLNDLMVSWKMYREYDEVHLRWLQIKLEKFLERARLIEDMLHEITHC